MNGMTTRQVIAACRLATMAARKPMREVYTTAPQAYDGFGSIELDADAGTDDRGMTVRRVAIEPEHYEWQTGRYASGMHGYATPAEVAKFSVIWRLWARD